MIGCEEHGDGTVTVTCTAATALAAGMSIEGPDASQRPGRLVTWEHMAPRAADDLARSLQAAAERADGLLTGARAQLGSAAESIIAACGTLRGPLGPDVQLLHQVSRHLIVLSEAVRADAAAEGETTDPRPAGLARPDVLPAGTVRIPITGDVG